ncbi:hypothetical protein V6N13_117866 [Hibiscus sabdariffa]
MKAEETSKVQAKLGAESGAVKVGTTRKRHQKTFESNDLLTKKELREGNPKAEHHTITGQNGRQSHKKKGMSRESKPKQITIDPSLKPTLQHRPINLLSEKFICCWTKEYKNWVVSGSCVRATYSKEKISFFFFFFLDFGVIKPEPKVQFLAVIMDSPQSVVSPFKNSVVAEPENQRPEFFGGNAGGLSSNGSEVSRKEQNSIGVLEVYVHQARDIQNICIYHKQDVYAKLCLTSDPESTVSTKIINGGGRNPVFNDKLRLNVRTVDSSLKIEIFMMSRVRNYLEDQLLGFALVPLSQVLLENGKLEKEFSLSSTDLFHSPSGFVQCCPLHVLDYLLK